jgi:acylphosphatase
MSNQLCMHCFVSGKVQGVWYRANTKKEADRLGLKGYARNLSDGRVEVLACGERDKLDELYQWLQRGPELARVTDVSREELPWQDKQDFATS